jgi:hypothetical protein
MDADALWGDYFPRVLSWWSSRAMLGPLHHGSFNATHLDRKTNYICNREVDLLHTALSWQYYSLWGKPGYVVVDAVLSFGTPGLSLYGVLVSNDTKRKILVILIRGQSTPSPNTAGRRGLSRICNTRQSFPNVIQPCQSC